MQQFQRLNVSTLSVPSAPGQEARLCFSILNLMNAKSVSTASPSRAELKDQIEAVLKFLPVPKDDFDHASVENNKLILVEDFNVEEDQELKDVIMSYIPVAKVEAGVV